MVVTSPVISKQPVDVFFGEIIVPDFAVPSCHPITLIDLSNTALVEKRFAKTKCAVSGSDSTHMDVTGPMNFEKKIRTFFS